MNVEKDYYVEITQLPADYSSDELKLEEEELKEIGPVHSAEDHERNPDMRDAAVYMISEGKNLTRTYIVDEIDGQGYIFRINNPHLEPSEGFIPHVFATLSSIVSL